MSSEIDLLMGLKGKRIVDFRLEWDEELDDYCLRWLKFDDDTYLSLIGEYPKNIVKWFVEDVEP